MKKPFYLIVLLWSVIQIACDKKATSTSIYENCCGTAPTADSVLLDTTGWSQVPPGTLPEYGRIYIPNIFIADSTSNNMSSGFMVLGGTGVNYLQSVVYSSENGEVFFSRETFLPNYPVYAWNGLKPDNTFHYGLFKYEVKVQFIDGQIRTYVGQACSVQCADNDLPNERLPACFFPEQNNGGGEPDQSQPYPKPCFE